MKHPRHGDYPADITALSERVLLTAWPTLADYHDDLVLLGGLVPRYLCRPRLPTLTAVTMDVDLGIALGANAGQYGSLSSHLAGIGFKRVDQRFVKRIREHVDINLDFLTEVPGRSAGTVMVDDVPTAVFLGIDRALAVIDWVTANAQLFLPFRVPKPPNFADLVNEVLLQQPPAPPEAEETGVEKGEPQPAHNRFKDDEIEAAAGLLHSMPSEFTLDAMLATGRKRGLSHNSLHHASLKVLQWFGEDGSIGAFAQPESLRDPTFYGNDVAVHRRT